MTQNTKRLLRLQCAFRYIPGIRSRATKRNVLVVLCYLFLFGLLLSAFRSSGAHWWFMYPYYRTGLFDVAIGVGV